MKKKRGSGLKRAVNRSEAANVATSIRDLGRKVGRSHGTIARWLRREDWPFKLVAPWEVDVVATWALNNLDEMKVKANQDNQGGREPSELTRAQTNLKTGQAELMRLRLMQAKGKVHDVKKCEERRIRQIHAVRSAMNQLGRYLAAELPGKNAADMERIIQCRVDAICNEFAQEPEEGEGR